MTDPPNRVDFITCTGELSRTAPDRVVVFELRYGRGRKISGAIPVALMTVGFGTQRSANGCATLPPCSRSMAAFRIPAPRYGAAPAAGAILEPSSRTCGSNPGVRSSCSWRAPDT